MRGGVKEAQFPFVSTISRESRQQLATLTPSRAAPRTALLERGDRVDAAYLVVAGSLRVYYITPAGREATLYHVEPGGMCLLALSSTLAEQPYPAWVEAGPDGGEFVRVSRSVFLRLLDAEAAFRQFVLVALSGRVFELMRALEEVGSVQVEQRVSRYLLRRQDGDGCVRISQVALAGELGTAREVVFRALRELSRRRLIETGRLRVRVLDRRGLERVADGAEEK